MEKCVLITVFANLSQFSEPAFAWYLPSDALSELTPKTYTLDWFGENFLTRSGHYQLNTWLDFAPTLLSANVNNETEASVEEQRKFVVSWTAD